MNRHHRPSVALRPNPRSTSAAEAGRRPAARAVVALAAGLVIAAGWVASARAETVSSIRLRLHPYAADGGQLPDNVKARLEALPGSPLTLTGTTRTGAVELALPAPRSRAEADAMLRALRQDRGVLWAEVPRLARRRSQVVGKAAGPTGATGCWSA